jgi:hypothetical protein
MTSGTRPFIVALTAAAFGFVAGILLIGKAPDEATNPVASISKFVLASDRR